MEKGEIMYITAKYPSWYEETKAECKCTYTAESVCIECESGEHYDCWYCLGAGPEAEGYGDE